MPALPQEKAESFSDKIIQNTPKPFWSWTGSRRQADQPGAVRLFKLSCAGDIVGAPVVRLLDPSNYLKVVLDGRGFSGKCHYVPEYKLFVDETVIYDRQYKILISIMRDVTDREEERKQQERFQKIQQKVEHQLNAISRQDPHGGRLLKKKMKAVKSLEHRFDREREDMTEFPDSEEAILVGFGEDTAVPAGKTVLDFSLPRLEVSGRALSQNLRLYVRGGEHVCILGPNGAGKTTLLRQIAGELLKRGDIRAAYMPQDYGETVNQDLTPVEFLAKSWEKAELTKVKTYLGSMKYTAEEQGHAVRELSGGQKAKLSFEDDLGRVQRAGAG